MDGSFDARMDSFWFIAYLVLAGLAIVQSSLLAMQTWEHRRYVRSCMTRRKLGSRPAVGHVAVFVPCKGHDVDLAGNLAALLRQDYDDYEVTFVVESADDPACATIRRVIAEHPQVPSRLVEAGCAIDTGQKVHNLRVATADLAPGVEYLAFVDSDCVVDSAWLVGGEHPRRLPDLIHRDPGYPGHFLRWVLTGSLLELSKAMAPFVHEFLVVKPFFNDDVYHRQQKGAVRPRPRLKP